MKIFLSLAFTLIATLMSAQSLEQYRWEHRLVLILTENKIDKQAQIQLKKLNAGFLGLQERKIIVIRLAPDAIKFDFERNGRWQKQNGQLYQKYKSSTSSFEVLLIGLDGGVKLREELPVELDHLYRLIDAMPMRRAEMNRKL